VREHIVAALSKHGNVYGEVEGESDFFVYDDKFFDRTQKIELELTERLPKILPAAVLDLQRVLSKNPLWRVMFIGDGLTPEKDRGQTSGYFFQGLYAKIRDKPYSRKCRFQCIGPRPTVNLSKKTLPGSVHACSYC